MSQMLVPSERWCAGSRRCPDPDPCCPPWRGGGQAAMHWAACCPPAGAQVTGESNHLHMLSGRARVQEGLWAWGWGRACADA